MSIYDKSSLVLIPSGTKTSKVYSQKPVPVYGAEQVTNGNFATDSDWTKGTGWTIGSGVASCDGVQTGSYLSQTSGSTLVLGKTYKVNFDLIHTSGTLFFLLASSNPLTNTSGNITTGGSKEFHITISTLSDQLIYFRSNQFNGSIDNVSVKEVLVADGDFDFTRSTAATRVNADGNIEKETSNLLRYSNVFNNASWVKTNTTLTSGQTGYDGSSNAWLLSKSAANGNIRQNITPTGLFTASVYLKAGTLNWAFLYLDPTTGTDPAAYINLNDGSVGTTSASVIDVVTESVVGGWYRCSITASLPTASAFFVFPADANNDISGTSGNILIQDAQLEQGLVARDYIETTTTELYGGITDNVPRLDYTDSSCPSLLLEPQRTNLINHSEYYGGADWSRTRCDFVTNTSETLSPEGLYNASKMTSTAIQESYAQDNVTLGSTSGTFTFFAKKGDLDYCHALVWDISANGRRQWFNLATGAVGTTTNFGSGYTKVDASIEDYGNGWYRCSFSWSGGNTTSGVRINLSSGDGIIDSPINSYGYFYGAQCEASVSYPTSYIPTYGTSVTRNGDAMSKDDLSSLLNSPEGTLFLEVAALADDGTNRYFSINDGTTSNYIYFRYVSTSNNMIMRVNIGGVTINTLTYVSPDTTIFSKVALKWKGGDYAFWVNGVERGTDTSAAAFGAGVLNEIVCDFPTGSGDGFPSKTKQVLYFPTALSDAELATLTTI